MEKINIKIEKFEHAIGKISGKPYCKFLTDKGWMNAFDSETIDPLKKSVGKFVEVEMIERKTMDGASFKNISKYIGVGKEEEMIEGTEKIQDVKPSVNRNATMYVSYAKDVFVELSKTKLDLGKQGYDKLMEIAIRVVKQAKEAFE